MKKTVLILSVICCFFGATLESQGNTYCSPIHTPFTELLDDYNMGDYIIVEGYLSYLQKVVMHQD